ncbi:unnamed protein product, partial [Prorocentrum cordatum]
VVVAARFTASDRPCVFIAAVCSAYHAQATAGSLQSDMAPSCPTCRVPTGPVRRCFIEAECPVCLSASASTYVLTCGHTVCANELGALALVKETWRPPRFIFRRFLACCLPWLSPALVCVCAWDRNALLLPIQYMYTAARAVDDSVLSHFRFTSSRYDGLCASACYATAETDSHTCRSDCDCDGARTCSFFSFCVGDASDCTTSGDRPVWKLESSKLRRSKLDPGEAAVDTVQSVQHTHRFSATPFEHFWELRKTRDASVRALMQMGLDSGLGFDALNVSLVSTWSDPFALHTMSGLRLRLLVALDRSFVVISGPEGYYLRASMDLYLDGQVAQSEATSCNQTAARWLVASASLDVNLDARDLARYELTVTALEVTYLPTWFSYQGGAARDRTSILRLDTHALFEAFSPRAAWLEDRLWTGIMRHGSSLAAPFELSGIGTFLLRIFPNGARRDRQHGDRTAAAGAPPGRCSVLLSGPSGVEISFVLHVQGLTWGTVAHPLRCDDVGSGCWLMDAGEAAGTSLDTTSGARGLVAVTVLSARQPTWSLPVSGQVLSDAARSPLELARAA